MTRPELDDFIDRLRAQLSVFPVGPPRHFAFELLEFLDSMRATA